MPGYGIAPISASQDTAGPMDRTVANAAMTLQSIAGYDPHNADYYRGIWGPGIADSDIIPPVPATVPNYMSALDLNFVRGKRIGWNGTSTEINEAKAALAAAGAILVERPTISPGSACPAARCSTTRRTATSTTTTRTSARTRRSSRSQQEIADNLANEHEALKFGNGTHAERAGDRHQPDSAASIAYRNEPAAGQAASPLRASTG